MSTQEISNTSIDDAVRHHQAGNLETAGNMYKHLLETDPGHPKVLYLMGMLHLQTQRPEKAEPCFRDALLRSPRNGVCNFALGRALAESSKPDEATRYFKKAIKLTPDYIDSYLQLAAIRKQQNKADDAITLYLSALKVDPANAVALNNLGNLYLADGRLEDAEQYLLQLLSPDTTLSSQDSALVQCNLATVSRQKGEWARALQYCQQAISLDTNLAPAYYNAGCIYYDNSRLEGAKKYFAQTLAINPNHADAQLGLAETLDGLSHQEEALRVYEAARSARPDLAFRIDYALAKLKLMVADWSNYDQRMIELHDSLQANISSNSMERDLPPFIANYFRTDIATHTALAQRYAAKIIATVEQLRSKAAFRHTREHKGVIKVGYISPDFREHPVGQLTQELFHLHDRSQFEIHAYSLVNIDDDVSTAIRAGCDQFNDVSEMALLDIAKKIHEDGINILIDLGGYTELTRPGVLAMQPAPIQAQFLGYPGSMALPSVQYIIADEQLVDSNAEKNYSEKIVRLRHAFLSSRVNTGSGTTTREQFNLPEQGFVFCCFNGIQKIEPWVFGHWMEILNKVPNSVLWLRNFGDKVCENLRAEAQSRGVAGERLIFAEKSPHDEYIARYQLADLFLDTFLYNAGSTAVAALQGGVPTLTFAGETNASRMCASILSAAMLPELITNSAQEYVAKAVSLATHPEEINALKNKLAENLKSAPLFDTAGFVKTLDKAYVQMWENYTNGGTPQNIVVK